MLLLDQNFMFYQMVQLILLSAQYYVQEIGRSLHFQHI